MALFFLFLIIAFKDWNLIQLLYWGFVFVLLSCVCEVQTYSGRILVKSCILIRWVRRQAHLELISILNIASFLVLNYFLDVPWDLMSNLGCGITGNSVAFIRRETACRNYVFLLVIMHGRFVAREWFRRIFQVLFGGWMRVKSLDVIAINVHQIGCHISFSFLDSNWKITYTEVQCWLLSQHWQILNEPLYICSAGRWACYLKVRGELPVMVSRLWELFFSS